MDNSKVNKQEQRKRQIKKYCVFVCMFVACVGCIWLIFAPSGNDKEKDLLNKGINLEVPQPINDGMIDSKIDAYEHEDMVNRNKDRILSLDDFEVKGKDKNVLSDEESGSKNPKKAINSSMTAYNDINNTLGNFYQQPKNDPEKERLNNEIEALKARLDEQDRQKNSVDEQLELIEKSYQLASKYIPQQNNMQESGGMSAEEVKNKIVKSSSKKKNDNKPLFVTVKSYQDLTVSALKQNVSNEEFVRSCDQERNFNFYSMELADNKLEKNTISACVHGDQTVIDGQSVNLRLLEPIQVDNCVIPKNTLIVGDAKLQGERLNIIISSLEYEGTIIPVELSVYDVDGKNGIYIPNSMDMDAIKEMVANMGTNMGTSINVSKSAGSQIAGDLSRGVIQGTSQYLAKKIRQVKVTLKAGHRVLLFSKEA